MSPDIHEGFALISRRQQRCIQLAQRKVTKKEARKSRGSTLHRSSWLASVLPPVKEAENGLQREIVTYLLLCVWVRGVYHGEGGAVVSLFFHISGICCDTMLAAQVWNLALLLSSDFLHDVPLLSKMALCMVIYRCPLCLLERMQERSGKRCQKFKRYSSRTVADQVLLENTSQQVGSDAGRAAS